MRHLRSRAKLALHSLRMRLSQAVFNLRMQIYCWRVLHAVLAGDPLPKPPRWKYLAVAIIIGLGLSACTVDINNSTGSRGDQGGVIRTVDTTRTGQSRI